MGIWICMDMGRYGGYPDPVLPSPWRTEPSGDCCGRSPDQRFAVATMLWPVSRPSHPRDRRSPSAPAGKEPCGRHPVRGQETRAHLQMSEGRGTRREKLKIRERGVGSTERGAFSGGTLSESNIILMSMPTRLIPKDT